MQSNSLAPQSGWRSQLFNGPNLAKSLALLIAFGVVIWQTTHPDWWFILDNVNLVFHESGHWLFWPLGEMMSALGGSVMQLLIPAVLIFYFWRRKNVFSGCLMGLWLAQSFFNVAHYAADAVQMQLPLLGGESSIHDWNFIFFKLNLLSQTAAIAGAIKTLGLTVLVFSLAAWFWFLFVFKTQAEKNQINFSGG